MKKQMIIGIALTLGIVVFFGIYAALESSRQAKAQTAVANADLLVGAKLFVNNCTPCHGQDGEGLQGPELQGTDLPKDTFTQMVRGGWPHTIMPAWSTDYGGPFTDLDIQNVVNWIYNWNEDILAQARAELGPAPVDTTKYASRGEQVFHEVGCYKCHGADGTGVVFTYSEATCSRCHPDPTNLLQYTPMVIGHEDQEVIDQVRNGGDFMEPFSTDAVSDADLQAIIDWIHTLPLPVIDGELLADLEAAKTALANDDMDTALTDLQAAEDAAPHDIWKAQIEKIAGQVDDDTGPIVIALINQMEANPQD
jgi:mono/diheme cytochrome c family protein